MQSFKRMAGKLGSHLGHQHKSDMNDELQHQSLPSPSSSAQYSSGSGGSQFDYRGSISTERTSMSGWSSKRGDSMISVEEEKPAEKPIERVAKRPKGSYRLSDFIVQRTLGTGSFGRVHLGMDSSSVSVHGLTNDRTLLS
jgi:protein kinase A